ncbi:MAG: hypothetical protein HC877_20690 [Thioploca sp.]|nr:hypothetical protein [Thioploca sp.]
MAETNFDTLYLLKYMGPGRNIFIRDGKGFNAPVIKLVSGVYGVFRNLPSYPRNNQMYILTEINSDNEGAYDIFDQIENDIFNLSIDEIFAYAQRFYDFYNDIYKWVDNAVKGTRISIGYIMTEIVRNKLDKKQAIQRITELDPYFKSVDPPPKI